ncbi:VWA domain-containing protein [Flavobacterium frigoris]|uniref:von Willebrand factor type A domain-containing protein n=1 Tax=Flavobacterium frigoris TaxID=229204 RepID=A0A1H9I0W4_FLAFI|nr:VWA domain-containing protein [Flavobacterium frigoris]SEQ68241.1 von Willebrand factor type A domain-containing protein [Flavobacterium frigoris]
MSKEIQKVDSTISTTTKNKLDLSKFNNAALSSALSNIELPRLFHQLVFFVLDGTGSMTWEGKTGSSKGEEIDIAIKKIIKRLLESKNKNCFDIGVYAFAEEHATILQPSKMANDMLDINYNPTLFFKENYKFEYLDDTLDLVDLEINNYYKKHEGKNCQSLVIILSDGAIRHFESASEKTKKIKSNQKTTVSSILFEDIRWSNDEDFLNQTKNKLKELASNNQNGHSFFISDVDPDAIRNHMIKSISTVSKID